ncbi:MAG: serine hydrolase domain-containing protein [Gammaproteobacteria bacterium]
MRVIIFQFCVLALLTGCAAQQREADFAGVLTAEARAIIVEYDLPGMTVAMAGPDGAVSIATGVANREDEAPMTPETTMLAASIGKTFVAATVLQLSEEGGLALDDPISRWLGDRVWFDRLPNGATITVRHLLQHRSGLPDHVHVPAFAALWPDQVDQAKPEDLIALTFETGPLFPAGEGWFYTDTGYLLVGLIIEAATGETYEDVVRRRFLEPVVLVSTGPSNRKVLPGLARGYVSGATGLGLPVMTTDDRGGMVWDPAVEWTGGGLYSTSRDLALWGRAFLSGRLVDEATYQQMLNGVAASDSDVISLYGLGIAIRSTSDWGPVYGHRGWIPGYVSSLQYYPDHDVAIAFQTNTDIGIIDSDRPAVLEIEERLAALILRKGS